MPLLSAAIITAGGLGLRMGSVEPKQFLPVAGRPILIRTIEIFLATGIFEEIILVTPADHRQQTDRLLAAYQLDLSLRVVCGGKTRQASVKAGLDALSPRIAYVAVHDGVRPFVSTELIINCLRAAQRTGAAICAVPVQDTLKAVTNNQITATIDRQGLWRAQTPQAAKVEFLRQAHAAAAAQNFTGTDEASLLELINCPVTIVEGAETNLKITVPEDIPMAESLLAQQPGPCSPALRIGHGYDAHRLVPGRPLILGGVTIPHATGLLGHSDADVLTHALCDAILGAAGAGDLGRHFPDSDLQYKGADSLELLKQVMVLAAEKRLQLINADLTIIAQQPKLAPYLTEMRQKLAQACQVSPSALNIKATTTEQMGFAGREEGIASHAVALLGTP